MYHGIAADKLLMWAGFFDKKIDVSIQKFKKLDTRTESELKRDIKKCYYRYLTTAQEYFLFRFFEKTDEERDKFLSDNLKVRYLISTTGEKVYREQLCDKYNFFKLTEKYFGRKAVIVGLQNEGIDKNEFMEFASKHNDLFAKPLSDSFGNGAHVVSIKSINDAAIVYDRLSNGTNWIVEDRIIQNEEMASWNSSSVNTVRLPCFLSSNGTFHAISPVLRVGRNGSVVDNAGGGGIIACIDVNTGAITTNGQDEASNVYELHPDSNKKFYGWVVPKWQELLQLAEEIHRNCLPHHRYIGFDFALTDKGWVVIEGNWGQFLNQYVDHKGVKKDFINFIK